MLGGLLSFTSPWLLAGLAALPVIWWLLRLTPPAPARIAFPPARMLEGLKPPERTPERSPWWLTALRMLAATLIILALAGPLYNPSRSDIPGGRPVLLVIDNGWASASRWTGRQKLIGEIIQRTETDQQPVIIAPTTGLAAGWSPEPLSPEKARNLAAKLMPLPAPAQHDKLADALRTRLDGGGPFNVIWLTDGIETAGTGSLVSRLQNLARGGSFLVAKDAAADGALALFGALGADKKLNARILNPQGEPRLGTLHALNAKGERIGDAVFALAAGERETQAVIELPLELQNQVARLEIAGEASAGAVYLLDARAIRHRVGIVSGDQPTGAQPLLSPTHYIEKALQPFTDVVIAGTGNLDAATDQLLKQKPSVIVLADIGRISGPVEERLKGWVEQGGLLIRFAGERMEQGTDALMPVRLREGGRILGGALSWSTPQRLIPFESNSVFFGLKVPGDVTVSRQILADPAAIMPSSQIWARLNDGTPLVTAEKRGAGNIVLFHVTGNPDWSNLPISGVFVEMFQRMLEKTATAMTISDSSAGAANLDKTPAAAQGGQFSFLAPRLTLNGYGALVTPSPQARSLPAEGFDSITPSPDAPPGYYGPAGDIRALNIIKADMQLQPLTVAGAAGALDYGRNVSMLLTPWLYIAAFVLFMIDAIVTMLMMTGSRLSRAAAGSRAATLLAVLALIAALSHPRSAVAEAGETAPQPPLATIEATLQTRLAYVVTGDDAIDSVSRAGLAGLSRVLAARTAVEPAEPMGVDVTKDELAVFPLLYWAVPDAALPLTGEVIAKIDAYMKSGGMIIFDTRDYQTPLKSLRDGALDFGATTLGTLLSKLDVPRLEPVNSDHVVTKSFYILRGFPGRWDGGELWVEAQTNVSDTQTRRALKSDGVSSILITSNDFAAAWALDDTNRPLYPVVPGGEEQRELAYRAGVNIVMYALTGNYKADQVHVPALLERLGH